MLRRLLNHCSFALRLETLEPLLIKSGASVISGPDMAFVRTNRKDRLQPFIPGSSLKGVLRSHGERIARSLQPRLVCDVFKESKHLQGCSFREKERAKENLKENLEDKHPVHNYRLVCAACRLFGSLIWKGRFHTSDAYLMEPFLEVEPELRDGIAIDRVTGGVAGGAKFDMEVLPAGVVFETCIEIQNFELWQLGWVAYIIRDLLDGHIRIGSGTARGLGRIRGHLDSLIISYIGDREILDSHIPGIGALASPEEREAYGLQENDQVQKNQSVSFVRPPGTLRSTAMFEERSEQLDFMASVAGAWDRFVNENPRLIAEQD